MFYYELKFPSKLIVSTSLSSQSNSSFSLAMSTSSFKTLVNRFVNTYTLLVRKASRKSPLVFSSILVLNIFSVYTRNASLYFTYSP